MPKKTADLPELTFPPVNEVLLSGRLSAPAQRRELPSGDILWSWRLIVDRSASSRVARASAKDGSRGASVDTIDCVTFAKTLGRSAERWQPGAILTVSGALRRRFFRTGAGIASRYEVECHAAKRESMPAAVGSQESAG